MAFAAARVCLACLVLQHGAAADAQGIPDEVALVQKELRSHSGSDGQQSPFGNMGDMLKGLMGPKPDSEGGSQAANTPPAAGGFPFPGLPGLAPPAAPAAPGAPGAPQMPSTEEVIQFLQATLTMLRNDTVVNALSEGFRAVHVDVLNSTQSLTKRYAQLNSSMATLSHAEVIPHTLAFLEGEIEEIKPHLQIYMRTMRKVANVMPLGEHAREVRFALGMAEPMLMKGFDDLVSPLEGTMEALVNASEAAFCSSAVPIVVNASASIGPLHGAEDQVQSMLKHVPELKKSPLALVMPDVVPKLVKLSEQALEVEGATIQHYETMSMLLNTTLRSAIFEKLHCDIIISQSGSVRPGVGLGLLAAMAALAGWLAVR